VSRIIYTFVLVVALAACSKKKEEPAATPAGSATPVVTADAATGSAEGSAAAAADPVDLPTEVDFEDSASTEITDKNVEARVKAIEAELQQ
jgi:hypothetical protein